MGLEPLMVNALKLNEYYVSGKSELVGMEYQDFHIFGAYTQSSDSVPVLFDSLSRIRISEKYGEKSSMFLMDANARHKEWLGSSLTDDAGDCALAFSEMYDLQQYIDFPTRGDNILDLTYCDHSCAASVLPHLGSSGRVTMLIKVDLSLDAPVSPPSRTVYHGITFEGICPESLIGAGAFLVTSQWIRRSMLSTL